MRYGLRFKIQCLRSGTGTLVWEFYRCGVYRFKMMFMWNSLGTKKNVGRAAKTLHICGAFPGECYSIGGIMSGKISVLITCSRCLIQTQWQLVETE